MYLLPVNLKELFIIYAVQLTFNLQPQPASSPPASVTDLIGNFQNDFLAV